MERRGILEFVGGVGFGTLLGYYAGAKALLGIQTDTDGQQPPAAATPTSDRSTTTEQLDDGTPTQPPMSRPEIPGSLVARYTFEGAGSTIRDVTGNEYDGNLRNASRKRGYEGQSLAFDEGNQEWATFGEADELNPGDGSITVEYWFRSTSSDNKNELVSNRGDTNIFLRTILRNGRVMFMLKDTTGLGGKSAVRTDETYNDGEWHHVIATRDTAADQLILTVDGTEHTAPDEEGDVSPDGSWLAGGNPRYPNPHYSQGMIDDLRIYK